GRFSRRFRVLPEKGDADGTRRESDSKLESPSDLLSLIVESGNRRHSYCARGWDVPRGAVTRAQRRCVVLLAPLQTHHDRTRRIRAPSPLRPVRGGSPDGRATPPRNQGTATGTAVPGLEGATRAPRGPGDSHGTT